jgi:alkanesulfonate monooxygenase
VDVTRTIRPRRPALPVRRFRQRRVPRAAAAATEEKAWQKAYETVGRIEQRVQPNGGALSRRRPIKNPENTGSQRLLAIAAEGERFDRALWTRTAAATGGAGNSPEIR